MALLSKAAAKKTAGVLGDDLALNAQQVSGLASNRELPVVWAVAKGSAVNKLILVPAALAFSAFAPWAVTPLLMIGGAFLCFEGCEKLAHKFLHSAEHDQAHHAALTLGTVATASFLTQVGVLIGIAAVMTVGVYGLVAGIVKLDAAGLYLSRKAGAAAVTAYQRLSAALRVAA